MDFSSKCDQIRSFLRDFVTFTEEIINGKLHFLRNETHNTQRTLKCFYKWVIRSTSRSVFINHIHLYSMIAVTLFPLFLNESLGQMSFIFNESFHYGQREHYGKCELLW